MKKIVFFITIFQMVLLSYEYDKLLLKAQIDTFPKLILLDKDISKKVIDNKIIFTILYHQSDYYRALEVKQMIEVKFHKLLDKYKLITLLKNFDDIKDDDNSNAYYILKGDLTKVKQLCIFAKKKGIPTFSYELQYLKQDVLFSLVIYSKAQIYLNKKVYSDYNIQFASVLYQIIRFFK